MSDVDCEIECDAPESIESPFASYLHSGHRSFSITIQYQSQKIIVALGKDSIDPDINH